jgi:hypothetical protein
MKRKLLVEVPGRAPISIEIHDNESISIHIDSPPTKFYEGEAPGPHYRIEGLRWTDSEHFHLGWGGGPLNLSDKISVQLLESQGTTTPPEKEEKYIEPEKECLFCGKKSSEVKHLVNGGPLARICDECVRLCQKAIEQNAT